MTAKQKKPSDYIVNLNMNGLRGRMLHMPAPKGKTHHTLFVYGHHSSLERWWGVMQDLNRYGSVTMPDMPGFGGMEAFYKIGEKPTIDNYADYLASFIKLKYKRKKVTILGLSFGFVVVTRMLQRYPELIKKVNILVSVVGFTRHDDFSFNKKRMLMYKTLAGVFSRRLPAAFFKYVCLNPGVLRLIYHRTSNAKHKFQDTSAEERKRLMDFEVELWHSNDVRTHMYTTVQFLQVDNCDQKVKKDVWHVAVRNDNYFDNHRVEQHLKVIFNDVNVVYAELANHAPSVIADLEEAEPMIPPQLRKLLT